MNDDEKFILQGDIDSFVVDYDDFSIGMGDEILIESRVFGFTMRDTEIDQEVEFSMLPDEVRKLVDWLESKLEGEEND